MDTFLGIDSDPVTLHKYLYTPNDPVNFIDPSGNAFATLGGFSAASSIRSVLLATAVTGLGLGLLDPSIDIELSDTEIGLLVIMSTNPVLGSKLLAITGSKTEVEKDSLVSYYRAVGTAEALDVMGCRCFRFPDLGFGIDPILVKRFWLDSSSAILFGNKFIKGDFVGANETSFFVSMGAVSKRFDKFILSQVGGGNPGDAFVGSGRAVSAGLLPALNAEMQRFGGVDLIGEY